MANSCCDTAVFQQFFLLISYSLPINTMRLQPITQTQLSISVHINLLILKALYECNNGDIDAYECSHLCQLNVFWVDPLLPFNHGKSIKFTLRSVCVVYRYVLTVQPSGPPRAKQQTHIRLGSVWNYSITIPSMVAVMDSDVTRHWKWSEKKRDSNDTKNTHQLTIAQNWTLIFNSPQCSEVCISCPLIIANRIASIEETTRRFYWVATFATLVGSSHCDI